MPQDIAGVVWVVGGGVIALLVGAAGFFVSWWMTSHSTKLDRAVADIAKHDTAIAVLQTDQANLLSKIGDVLNMLREHITKEENFWIQNSDSHSEILNRLSSLETRHTLEDRQKEAR